MRIMLISGHGAGDPGAMATIDGVMYREADLTVELVKKIYDELSKYNVTVLHYDYNRDAYKDYKSGVLSFDKSINYILEIHFNACVKDYSGDGRTTGTEIYYPSRGTATGAENAILKRVAAFGLRNRGSFSKQLAVINTAAGHGIPANLLEVCFIDDADDMRLYMKQIDAFAREIAAGVADAFGLKKKEEKPAYKPWWEKSGEWADAKRLGLMDGTRPTDPVTRAELAAVAIRVIDYLVNYIKEVEKL